MLAPRTLCQTPGKIFRIVRVTYGSIAPLIFCAPIVVNGGQTAPHPPDTPAVGPDKA
jgi:hypothetical protein